MVKLLLLSILSGYLLGSIPFPQLMARWRKGIDLRTVGSQNVGGMNAMRNVGWGWGFLAGVGDFLKGIAALAAARALGAPQPLYLLAGLAALLGHNYPPWLGFRGGKGIAVGLGLALWVAPLPAVFGFVPGLGLLLWTKNVTVAGAVGFLLMIGLTTALPHQPGAAWALVGALLLMLLGILPEALRMLRTPGAVREYFRDPIKVYRRPKE
ncbi:MAG: glycerol-3-phosphate acyltransferase [Chloroflexi bacterium]|nr:glycerol-3-phosphate acyltransferase [Chloroflexota bacterium]